MYILTVAIIVCSAGIMKSLKRIEDNTKKMERYTAELLAKTKRLDFIFEALRKIQELPDEF